jgi:hypothetical protein
MLLLQTCRGGFPHRLILGNLEEIRGKNMEVRILPLTMKFSHCQKEDSQNVVEVMIHQALTLFPGLPRRDFLEEFLALE